MLDFENAFVTMVQLRREAAIVALFTSCRIDQQKTGGFEHNCRTIETIDEPHPEISPSHQTSGRDDVPVFDDDLVGLKAHIRKALMKCIDERPMRRHWSAPKQVGSRQYENAAAVRCECCAGGMKF